MQFTDKTGAEWLRKEVACMSRIKYLVMDVDGTLTDGKIYMGNDGEFCKAFSIKDGCGIHDIAIPGGIIPVIITGRTSRILENRCRELGVRELHQGISDKKSELDRILGNESYDVVAYIGDDINDLSCMEAVHNLGGVVGCPSDAVKRVIDTADFVSSRKGGDGAVREFIEWIVQGANESE